MAFAENKISKSSSKTDDHLDLEGGVSSLAATSLLNIPVSGNGRSRKKEKADIVLSALKIFTPIIASIFDKNKNEFNKDLLLSEFTVAVNELNSVSEKICELSGVWRNGVENYEWTKNAFEAELTKLTPIFINRESRLVALDALMDMVKRVAESRNGDIDNLESRVDEVVGEVEWSSGKIKINLAILGAIGKISSTMSEAPLFRKVEHDIEAVVNMVLGEALSCVKWLTPSKFSEDDRSDLVVTVINQAVDVYCSVWKREADRVATLLRSVPAEKVKEVIKTRMAAGGMPITGIEDGFKLIMAKSIAITKKIYASSKD